jgi:hypothetical protein
MIIGVDRLDYSKGIALRMEAFDRFLSTHPEWRGKVTYLQITPKSRSEIREYADMERQIDETAGRINGKYGRQMTPIRYVNRSHSRSALVALSFRSRRTVTRCAWDELLPRNMWRHGIRKIQESSFCRGLPARLPNAKLRFVNHTILKRLGLLSRRRCRCHWRSDAAGVTLVPGTGDKRRSIMGRAFLIALTRPVIPNWWTDGPSKVYEEDTG